MFDLRDKKLFYTIRKTFPDKKKKCTYYVKKKKNYKNKSTYF